MKAPPCDFAKNIGKMKMLSMEFRTSLPPEETRRRLKDYFGGDLGLKTVDDSPGCLTFEGGGGRVTATLCREGDRTKLGLVTSEWAYHVKEFVSRLP